MDSMYGERLAQIRDELGWTQEQMADTIGIPPRTLQDIEAGKVTRPQRATRAKIDAFLGSRREGETREEWPEDLRVFLDLFGAYLANLPESERIRAQNRTIRRMAQRDY